MILDKHAGHLWVHRRSGADRCLAWHIGLVALGVLAVLVGACSDHAKAPPETAMAAGYGHQPDGTYRLSPTETELDCERLRGKMLVQIQVYRSDAAVREPTLLARGLRSLTQDGKAAAAPTDRASLLKRGRARLNAYHARLKALKCKPFNLDAELAKPVIKPPTAKPRRPAPAKATSPKATGPKATGPKATSPGTRAPKA
ncbi:MAG: hypothetical protein AAFR04_04490 [Pseudomonadota bacterium]